MNNLFVITTPFQLIGAFEAIYKFKLTNNLLVIIDNSLENNSKQITSLLENNENIFSKIIRLGIGKKSKFLSNVKLIKNLKRESFNYVFIGDLGSIQKILISNVKSKKVFLLDDGAKTILIHKALKDGKEFFKKGFRQLRFNFFGLRTSTSQPFNIFTFFNLSNIDGIEIIKHQFNHLKKLNKFDNKSIENKVFILGQPIVENERVNPYAYEKYLNFIIDKHKDCEIFYLMHRREDKKRLLNYNLCKSINIVESKKPGEFFFVELSYKPKAIYGVNTTLLFSLANIFNDLSINSYKFNNEDILKNQDWFTESVVYFEKNKINLIKEKI